MIIAPQPRRLGVALALAVLLAASPARTEPAGPAAPISSLSATREVEVLRLHESQRPETRMDELSPVPDLRLHGSPVVGPPSADPQPAARAPQEGSAETGDTAPSGDAPGGVTETFIGPARPPGVEPGIWRDPRRPRRDDPTGIYPVEQPARPEVPRATEPMWRTLEDSPAREALGPSALGRIDRTERTDVPRVEVPSRPDRPPAEPPVGTERRGPIQSGPVVGIQPPSVWYPRLEPPPVEVPQRFQPPRVRVPAVEAPRIEAPAVRGPRPPLSDGG